jgi:hypothetical protein
MFHSDLNYDIVRLRQEELIAAANGHRATRAKQQRFWARWSRRGAEPVSATTSASESLSRHLHAVPPPRHERQPTGHDDSRVA